MKNGQDDSSIFLPYMHAYQVAFFFNLTSKFVEKEATDLFQALISVTIQKD